ncbi:MAG: flagellar hook protein FlgE [Methylobacterium sp.]
MSIGGLMRTSVSGMSAQANRLGAVSDNIANSNTTGYKKSFTEFSTMVLDSSPGQYNSGVVESQTRTLISQQGGLAYTSNANNSQAVDLAVNGKGFFIVGDGDGGNFLTRAGAFVKNGNGDLVNAAGYILKGYPLPTDDVNGVVNGFTGLTNVNLNSSELRLKPTNTGMLKVNLSQEAKTTVAGPLPTFTTGTASDAQVVGTLPSANPATPTAMPAYTSKTSMVVYDNAGKEVTVDIYMTKTKDGGIDPATGAALNPAVDDEWEVVAYDRSTAATTGAYQPFPYGGGGTGKSLITTGTAGVATLKFNQAGKLTTTPTGLGIKIPNGQTMNLDMAGSSSVSGNFQVLSGKVNGNPPGNVDKIKISDDGIVSATFASGEDVPLFKIPLAMVESPDNLKSLSGNVYSAGVASGTILVGVAGQSGLGTLVHGALEESTVDLASELTTMIESQRGYTANSKVFQTGSEILDVLVNLKR